MATAVSTYAFLNAKLRARIAALLDEEFLQSIGRTRSFVEAVGLLSGTAYGTAAEVYNRTGDVTLLELEIRRVEWATLFALRGRVPASIEVFTDALLGQLEVASLKQALRLWFERTVKRQPIDDKIAYLLRDGSSDGLRLEECVNADSPRDLLAALSDRPYASVLSAPLAALSDSGSLFAVEVAIDRWYYGELIAQANALPRRDRRVTMRLLGLQIDLRNVNWIVRLKRYPRIDQRFVRESVIPDGRLLSPRDLEAAVAAERPVDQLLSLLGPEYGTRLTGSDDAERGPARLALFEETLRSILLHEVHRILGGYPFTIGTMLAYVLLVRNEAQMLVTILNGVYYGLSAEPTERVP